MTGLLFAVYSLGAALLVPVPTAPSVLPAGGDSGRLLASFAGLPEKKQEQILEEIRFELAALDAPFLKAIRLLALQAGLPGKPRIDKFPPKSKSRTGKGDFVMPFPITREYVFGIGIIVPVGGLYSAEEMKRADPRRGARHETASKKLDASRRKEALAALLAGLPPDLDLALAALLQRLDRDPGADRFFAFLESWRNDEESFYQALDRTAGTEDSVFFFDAMLDDFVVNFLPKHDPAFAFIRGSLQAAHDALHDAFLVYRQYRAFREALAFSLVLPRGVPLPPTLARYEAKPKQGYCLREQAALLLALCGQNPGEAAALIAKGAEPLPDPLWSKRYDPFAAFNREFNARLPAMVALAGDTDLLLARQEAERGKGVEIVKNTALEVLNRHGVEAPGPPKGRPQAPR